MKKTIAFGLILLMLVSVVSAYEKKDIDINKVDTELAKAGIEDKTDREKLSFWILYQLQQKQHLQSMRMEKSSIQKKIFGKERRKDNGTFKSLSKGI